MDYGECNVLTAYLLCPEFVRDEEACGHRLLAEGDQIGRRRQIEVLVGPPAACRTEACLHFVHDERHFVLRGKENFRVFRPLCRRCNSVCKVANAIRRCKDSVSLNTKYKEPSCKWPAGGGRTRETRNGRRPPTE